MLIPTLHAETVVSGNQPLLHINSLKLLIHCAIHWKEPFLCNTEVYTIFCFPLFSSNSQLTFVAFQDVSYQPLEKYLG